MISLSSNTIVVIKEGAVVEAGFIANNKSNIAIVGKGVISGACFERNANNNTKLIPFEFNYCSNIKFENVVCLDPAGWCYNLYFCNQIEMDQVRIISSRSNGDGISVQSCQNFYCQKAFVRSWDDSLVVKNYPRWSNKNIEGTTRNVEFKDCLIWTDLAQSMEIGYETVGNVMEDITFDNIIVLHNFHLAPISIHNSNNANIKNVTFSNITIEDASMGNGNGKNCLIDFSTAYSPTWSNGHKVTSLGSIDGVKVSNVLVLKGNENIMISITGSIDTREAYLNSVHKICNVEIKNVKIIDTILNESYADLNLEYAENVTFINDKEATGCSYSKYYDASKYSLAFILN